MSAWTKLERLQATIAGEKPDRPPAALWRHWPGDDQNAESLASAHLKWQHDYDWDLIKVSPASSYCLVDWGVIAEWEGSFEGTRVYKKRIVSQSEDWRKLTVLNPQQGMLAVQLEALKKVGQRLKNEFEDPPPFIATIFSPLSQAKNIAGEERMLSHMRSDPGHLQQGLDTIARSTIDYIKAAVDTGIDGIFYAVQHARFSKMSAVEYQHFGRPHDEEILSLASDLPLNMVHIHGEEGIIFDLVADYPVQIVNWHDRDTGFSLSDGLKQVSGAVCGGVSRWSLYKDSPDAAISEARDAVNQTGGRRLLLGVGCVVMTNTPLQSLRAFRSFVEDVRS